MQQESNEYGALMKEIGIVQGQNSEILKAQFRIETAHNDLMNRQHDQLRRLDDHQHRITDVEDWQQRFEDDFDNNHLSKTEVVLVKAQIAGKARSRAERITLVAAILGPLATLAVAIASRFF